jgi:hypothetical protein
MSFRGPQALSDRVENAVGKTSPVLKSKELVRFILIVRRPRHFHEVSRAGGPK